MVTDPDRAFSATGEDYASWEAYVRQPPGRETLDRHSRCLAKLGPVTFEHVESPEAKAACLTWLSMRKAEQLREKGYEPAWGDDSSRLEAFMKLASTRVSRFGALLMRDRRRRRVARADQTLHGPEIVPNPKASSGPSRNSPDVNPSQV
jgi:hypothetical protein